MSEGKGQIIVNNRDYKDYFPDKQLHYVIDQPLNLLELKNNYDIKVNLESILNLLSDLFGVIFLESFSKIKWILGRHDLSL